MTVTYEKSKANSVKLNKETVSFESGSCLPGKYYGDSQTYDLDFFKENFKINVINSKSDDLLEFDMIGVDASFANAVRRIVISEIPTVAAEQVFIMKNSSLLSDEILSHRLGLVPIHVDPSKMIFPDESKDELNEDNTLVFELQVECKSKGLQDDTLDFKDRFDNHFVYSKDLQWVPQGNQLERFGQDPPRPLIDDIVIAKLRPGQVIDLKIFCFKGIGADHAKWSPVATASYRLLPDIRIKEEIKGRDAVKFSQCFPPGVIGLTPEKNEDERKAFVQDARKDTVSRECLRHAEFEGKVELCRKRDHFIFMIESVGSLKAKSIVEQSLKILIEKCKRIKGTLEEKNLSTQL